MLDAATRLLLPFDAARVLGRARRKARWDDFGGPGIHEPLQVLLGAFREEARLTVVGRVVAWNDLGKLLVNRLRMQADRQRWSDIAAETVSAPIVITGLPRTGTTLLHGLLARDPRLRAPLTWEVMDPSPPPGTGDAAVIGRRIRGAAAQLRWLDRLAPGFQAIHEVGAELPQECIAMTAQSLLSLRFLVTYRLPSYARYLQAADMRPCYAGHRRFLQHLQFRREPRRWVLKAPSHLPDLDALFAEYPDAVVVQTHRDPVVSIPSLASLRVAMRSAFSRAIDLAETGAEVAGYWRRALQRSARVRAQQGAQSFIDVCYDELTADPVAAVQAVYRRLDLTWRKEDERRVHTYLQAHPQGKHGRHSYRAEDFGLSSDGLAEAFADYRQRMAWA